MESNQLASKIIFVTAILFVAFFTISLVSAAQPLPQTADNEELNLFYPQQQAIKILDPLEINLHVTNATTLQNSSTTDCLFHLYNRTGSHTLEADMNFNSNSLDFQYSINGNNFTEIGLINWIFQCNNSNGQIGTVKGEWDVTGTGMSFETPIVHFYIGIMAILAFFFLITVSGIFLLPSQDYRDSEGTIMSVNLLKHFRFPLAALAWGFLVTISFLAWNLAEAYLSSELVVMIFRVTYSFLLYTLMIAIPVIFAYTFIKFMEDKKMQGYLNRGLQ